MKHLMLFVCAGNICRSPMAEYLFKNRILNNPEWETCSAGIIASYGQPASQEGVIALEEKGLDLTPHRSQPLSADIVKAATVITVMTQSQLEQIACMFPDIAVREKTFLLRSFDPEAAAADVDDPIGMSLDVYRRVRDEIDSALHGLVEFIEEKE